MHKFIPFVLFIAFFFLSVIVSPQIGPSRDEPDNIFAGGVYHNFIKNGFDQSILALRYEKSASVYGKRIYTQNFDLERYPAFPLLIGSGAVWLYERIHGQLTGQEIITLYHIASGLFLSLTVVATYGISRLLKQSHHISILAALIVGFLPTMFGHGLSTIKDSAQVSMFTTSLYFLLHFNLSRKKRWLIYGAIVWGLGLATKFNAIYVPIIWFSHFLAMLVLPNIFQLIQPDSPKKVTGSFVATARTIITTILSFFCIGCLTMFIVWPYLWFQPWEHLLQVIRYFTTVGIGYEIAWNGQSFTVGMGKAYWWYPLGSLILATPLIILITAAFSLIYTSVRRFRHYYHFIKNHQQLQTNTILLGYYFFGLWLIIPFIRLLSASSSYYDGMRHFMEVLPVIAIVSAIGLHQITSLIHTLIMKHQKLTRYQQHLQRFLFLGVTIVTLAHLLYINARLFPFSSAYLNFLAGSNVNLRFDRDFSGLAVFEGMKFVNQHYQQPQLWVPIAGHLSWYYVPERGTYVYNHYDADTIVYVNKISHSTLQELEALLPSNFQLVHTIQRGSDIFGWVYRKQ